MARIATSLALYGFLVLLCTKIATANYPPEHEDDDQSAVEGFLGINDDTKGFGCVLGSTDCSGDHESSNDQNDNDWANPWDSTENSDNQNDENESNNNSGWGMLGNLQSSFGGLNTENPKPDSSGQPGITKPSEMFQSLGSIFGESSSPSPSSPLPSPPPSPSSPLPPAPPSPTPSPSPVPEADNHDYDSFSFGQSYSFSPPPNPTYNSNPSSSNSMFGAGFPGSSDSSSSSGESSMSSSDTASGSPSQFSGSSDPTQSLGGLGMDLGSFIG